MSPPAAVILLTVLISLRCQRPLRVQSLKRVAVDIIEQSDIEVERAQHTWQHQHVDTFKIQYPSLTCKSLDHPSLC